MRKIEKIDIKATEGKQYDLDKIADSSRDNASLPITLQHWYWHPEATGDWELHANPNPLEPEVGMVWISVKCRTVDEMIAMCERQNNTEVTE